MLQKDTGRVVLPISQSWSLSGRSGIRYVVTNSATNANPSWVTHQAGNSHLVVNTASADITTGNKYQIILTSNHGDISSDKTIEITVLEWGIKNCATCESDFNTCAVWDQGYTMTYDKLKWQMMTIEVQAATSLGQAAVASGATASTVSAAISSSSSQGAWSTINQYQLFLLLPIIGADIHEDILMFLEGFSFSSFSLNFLHLDTIPFIEDLLIYFPAGSSKEYFHSIGVENLSAFKNSLGLILILLWVILVHLSIVVPLKMFSTRYSEEHKFHKLAKAMYFLFTFTIYIRVILESLVIVYMSWLNELWFTGVNSGLAILILIGLFWLSKLVTWIYVIKSKSETDGSYFKEFFNG